MGVRERSQDVGNNLYLKFIVSFIEQGEIDQHAGIEVLFEPRLSNPSEPMKP